MGEDHSLRAIARKDAYFVLQIDKHRPGHHICRLSGVGHSEIVEEQAIPNERPRKLWMTLELFYRFKLERLERQLDPPAGRVSRPQPGREE